MKEIVNNLTFFNPKPFISIGLIFLVLYFVLKVIKRIVIPLLKREHSRKKMAQIFPIIEGIIWGIFSVFAVIIVIQHNPILGTILIGLIIAFSWTFIRNYVSGLIIQLGGTLQVGQHIKLDDFEGTIVGLNRLSVELELNNGEKVNFPYYKFGTSTFIKTTPSEKIVSDVMELATSKALPVMDIKEEIYQNLIIIPWNLPIIKPKVDLLREEKEQYVFKVVLHSIDKKYFLLMRNRLNTLRL